MIRHRFTTARSIHSIAAILNRMDRAADTAELEQAAEFSDWFDREMNRANRASFWESTCAA